MLINIIDSNINKFYYKKIIKIICFDKKKHFIFNNYEDFKNINIFMKNSYIELIDELKIIYIKNGDLFFLKNQITIIKN